MLPTPRLAAPCVEFSRWREPPLKFSSTTFLAGVCGADGRVTGGEGILFGGTWLLIKLVLWRWRRCASDSTRGAAPRMTDALGLLFSNIAPGF